MMLLHQVLPKDENGNKKMVETFLEGKMMLTDPMNGKGSFINYNGNSLVLFLPHVHTYPGLTFVKEFLYCYKRKSVYQR